MGTNPLTNECHAAFLDPGVTVADLGSGVAGVSTNSNVNPNQVKVIVVRKGATPAFPAKASFETAAKRPVIWGSVVP